MSWSEYVTASTEFISALKARIERDDIPIPGGVRKHCPFPHTKELLLWIMETTPPTYEDEGFGDGSTRTTIAESLDRALCLLGIAGQLPEWMTWRRVGSKWIREISSRPAEQP